MAENYFEAEVLERLTNQGRDLDHLDNMTTLARSRQVDLPKELRATHLRHGEMLEELSHRVNAR